MPRDDVIVFHNRLRGRSEGDPHPGVYPLGTLGYAEATAAQTGVGTTEADLTDLSVTVDVGTGRTIRARLFVHVEASDVGGVSEVRIRRGGNTVQIATHQHQAAGLTGQHIHILERVFTGMTGSQTIKGVIRRVGGTGTLDTAGSSLLPNFVLVEDIGAA